MMKNLIIGIVIVFLPILSIAGPTISSLSSSNFAADDRVKITGTGFGSHALEIEWLGGTSGNIEKGSGVFVKSKWSADSQSISRQAPVYSKEKAHSGSQSILSALPVKSQYSSGFSYDHGRNFDSIYASYWVYFEHVDSLGQWKMWRIRPVSANIYGDTNGEIMSSQWYTTSGGNYQNYVMLYCDKLNYSQCYPSGISDYFGDTGDIVTPGMWVRFEIYAKGSSVDGQNDGKFYYTITRNGETTHVMRDYSGITTRLSGSEKWRYFVLENYWGNIGAGGDGTKEKMFFDDIYLQMNNRARIEIGNKENWSECTHREIQIPQKWNPRVRNEETIEFVVNQGSFNSGPAYLFVVDENGVPSKGKMINFK